MLIDADYITKAGRAVIRLVFKRKRFFRLYDEKFEPYFFVDVNKKGELEHARKELEKISVKDNQGNEVKFERIEEVEKELLGEKKKVLRAVCVHPSHVVLLREKAREFGATYEDNILFGRRYLIDKKLTPFNEYEVKRKGKNVVSIGEEKEVVPSLRLMSFDIETYNPSGMPRENIDPVVMVSFADEESGVLSWKPIARKFVKILADEKAMLAEFCRLLKEKDVELLVGYNSAAFDFSYLKARAKALGKSLSFGRDGSGILLRRRGMVNTAKITGRIHVDLYPVIRFMGMIGALKGFRYTLGEAYSELVAGEKEGWKEEVEKREIWRMWDDEKQLPKLAEYSLKDAQATREIALKIMPLQYELCKLVKLPLFDVAGMTSGQLVEMLLLNKAHNAGMIAPNKPGGDEAEGRRDAVIEGAFVKMPTPGIYENLAVFDFRSLYPSIITSHNVDNATLNCSCCSKKEAFVSPNGHAFCSKKKGLIPNTLEELVERRKKLKGEIRECKDEGKLKMLEARSQALKILSNSVYGMFRFARARWYSRECGEAITAWGRHYINDVIEKAGKEGFEVTYGDSVTGDRFVTLLNPQGMVEIKRISELFEENSERSEKVGEKEVASLKGFKALGVDQLTGKTTWGNVKEAIRHKANKRVFKVSQKYGETRVTEDHSFMIEKNNQLVEAKPREMLENAMVRVERIPPLKQMQKIDFYELLKRYENAFVYKNRSKTRRVQLTPNGEHVFFGWMRKKSTVLLKRFIQVESKEFEALCRLLGAYIAEGSASTPETTTSRLGASISASDKAWLEQLKKDYHSLFSNVKASIIQSMKKQRQLNYTTMKGKKNSVTYVDKTLKLQMMNALSAVFFKQLCGQKSSGKKLPGFAFHVPEKYRKIILENFLKGDGSITKDPRYTEEYKQNNFTLETKSLQLACGLTLLLPMLGKKYSMRFRQDKQTYIITTCSKHTPKLHAQIEEQEYDGFVYDLNVEGTHNFVDSCGQILLHNTDSVFLQLGKKTREQALEFMRKVNAELPKGMELELEAFYPRGVFVGKKTGASGDGEKGAKKKYALLREDGKIKIRGFELVRRDWSDLAKETQSAVLESILKKGSKEKAVEIVKKVIKELKEGKVPLEKLVIHTQLRKKIGKYEILSPEVTAAIRAKEKGIRIEEGAVIDYVVGKSGGERVSDRSIVVELAKDYDPNYYIENQILPSVMKILSELGVDEHELKGLGKQATLGGW